MQSGLDAASLPLAPLCEQLCPPPPHSLPWCSQRDQAEQPQLTPLKL